MDETDRRLLKAYGQELAPSYRELARRLGLSPSAVHKRVRSLTAAGIYGKVPLVPAPNFFDALDVLIFGHSGTVSMEATLGALGRSPCTSRVLVAGGNELYVHAVIPGLSELKGYAEFVRRDARMPDALVGILRPPVRAPGAGETVSHLDYRIMRALRDDFRQRLVDVAAHLRVGPKTVARRLRRLADLGAVSPLLVLRPERPGYLATVVRVRLRESGRPGRDFPPANIVQSPGFLGAASFTNLPEWSVCLAWGGHLGDVLKFRQRLDAIAAVESSVLNFIIGVRDYHTWLDKTIAKRAEAGTADAGFAPRKGAVGLDVVTRLDTYRGALKQALEDGVITDDEEAILRALRDSLDITDDEHRSLVRILRQGKGD